MGSHSRREFVRRAVAGAFFASIPTRVFADSGSERRRASGAIRLGVASYSLRNLSRDEAIETIKALDTPFVNLKSMHLPYELTPEEIVKAVHEFDRAGLQIVGGGVIYLKNDDDADIRFHFDYAKAAGFPMMVIGPTRETLPRIERFVQEYDIPVAIHNHGPDDEHFPAPSDALEFIKDMDKRIGVCVDLGHTARTGNDVVQEIANSGRRLLDVHMKDLTDLSEGRSQCVVGDGAMPVADIFRQLIRMNYPGFVNLEFEIDADDPFPGMQRSFSYMRGVIAGIS